MMKKNYLLQKTKIKYQKKNMSDEFKDNKIEAKSADSSSGGYATPVEHIPAKEAPEQELYHAKSYWTKWVFSQE